MKAAAVVWTSSLVAACILLAGCSSPTPPVPLREILLPTPRQEGEVSLEAALASRRSVRSYSDRALTWEEISQLLWAAQGVTDPRGFRTAPSAGALYPLELYLVLPSGWYHYLPDAHRLEQLGDRDLRGLLWQAGLEQEALRDAPAVVVITGVIARTEERYASRAERYVTLEAGHAAQNLLLQAAALGLGAVPIGAFEDDQARAALELPASYSPLYLIPVGEPE